MQRSRKSKTDKALSRKRILLTSGDPNGIGPEIILKIFSRSKLTEGIELFVCGNRKLFEAYSTFFGFAGIPYRRIIDVELPSGFEPKAGAVDKLAGRHAGDCIVRAVELCMKGKFDAFVTLPLSKKALNLGGYKYPGHTEMITRLTGMGKSLMLLHSAGLSVCLVTNHLPLSKVSSSINTRLIFEKVITANNSLVRDFGIRNPRIALLALNPHGGDGGLLGREETDIITPAAERLRETGFNVSGPFPADGHFATGSYKRFDLTVAMYHDQGLIPFKALSFGNGVNFTAGLPVVRTSPDHGTAFDIAGMGIADISSTIEAIKTAAMIAGNWKGKEKRKAYL